MNDRTVQDMLAGDVERVRLAYDVKGDCRLHATVHLVGESANVRFEGEDALAVAQWVTAVDLSDGASPDNR